MAGTSPGDRPPPLPPDSLTCRQEAAAALEGDDDPQRAIAWALLGIGAELAARRQAERRNR
ncbi:hypothetical protein [Kitasatospora sp. MBT63]|uniref:hypothetical protein n=1 Tax=Kitasatospora sp. MBT63 TaxID=1444768 RepID=UPI00053B6CD2|nr:hypothetical protein [Kitasatospora sp. MBT63]